MVALSSLLQQTHYLYPEEGIVIKPFEKCIPYPSSVLIIEIAIAPFQMYCPKLTCILQKRRNIFVNLAREVPQLFITLERRRQATNIELEQIFHKLKTFDSEFIMASDGRIGVEYRFELGIPETF